MMSGIRLTASTHSSLWCRNFKHRPIFVEFIETGRIRKGETLDFCSGAGTNRIYLAKQEFTVIGINISKKAIRHATAQAEHAQVNFMIQSFADLSIRDETFDFVFNMFCFHHAEPEYSHHFIMGRSMSRQKMTPTCSPASATKMVQRGATLQKIHLIQFFSASL